MTEKELFAIMRGYASEPEQQLERAHFQVSHYLRKTQVKRAALIHRMYVTDYERGYAAALKEKIETLQSILELSFGEPPMSEDFDSPPPKSALEELGEPRSVLLKSMLMMVLARHMELESIPASELVDIYDMPVEKIRDLRLGRPHRLTLEELVDAVDRLGLQVDLNIEGSTL